MKCVSACVASPSARVETQDTGLSVTPTHAFPPELLGAFSRRLVALLVAPLRESAIIREFLLGSGGAER